MLEGLVTDLQAQGPWGVLAAILLVGNVVQWKRSTKKDEDMSKERRDWFEQSVETTAALVELNVLFRQKK